MKNNNAIHNHKSLIQTMQNYCLQNQKRYKSVLKVRFQHKRLFSRNKVEHDGQTPRLLSGTGRQWWLGMHCGFWTWDLRRFEVQSDTRDALDDPTIPEVTSRQIGAARCSSRRAISSNPALTEVLVKPQAGWTVPVRRRSVLLPDKASIVKFTDLLEDR